MSTDILPFDFDGQRVRVVMIGSEPTFALTDVCAVLNIGNPSQVASRLEDDALTTNEVIDSMGRSQSVRFVNEPGLYEVIFLSRKPEAKAFKRWVTHEVIPSIRKTGSYGVPQLTGPALYLAAIEQAQAEIAVLEAAREKDKTKVLFADSVAASHTSILVGELAKILKGNGMNIGGTRLFAELRRDGFLIKREGTDRNMPTQYAMERGLFEIKETVVTHSDGHVTISKTPKVTGRGQQYFIDRYLSHVDMTPQEIEAASC